jgi:hypothetical protein
MATPGRARVTSCSSTAFVSAQTEKVVEFFLEREAADAMISEVRKDEPALAEDLGVEAIELGLG